MSKNDELFIDDDNKERYMAEERKGLDMIASFDMPVNPNIIRLFGPPKRGGFGIVNFRY